MENTGKRARLIILAIVAFSILVYILPTEVIIASALSGTDQADVDENSRAECERGLESGQGSVYGLKKNCDYD